MNDLKVNDLIDSDLVTLSIYTHVYQILIKVCTCIMGGMMLQVEWSENSKRCNNQVRSRLMNNAQSAHNNQSR